MRISSWFEIFVLALLLLKGRRRKTLPDLLAIVLAVRFLIRRNKNRNTSLWLSVSKVMASLAGFQ